nr:MULTISPECIES: hypothetical protein [unclassified Allomuricauda]|tara:strand:- start:22298 stop:22441 length:144 start_codon:yes stop_codon:yes gene_type:complete
MSKDKNQLKLDFNNCQPSKKNNNQNQVKVIDISNRAAIYKRIIGRTN